MESDENTETPSVSETDDNDATRILRPEERIYRPKHQDAPADGDATRVLQRSGGDDATSQKTQLLRRPFQAASPPLPTGPGSSLDDPVTGWLVIIEGAGKGNQIPIGEQDNKAGRGGGLDHPRLSLDFGDRGIPRNNAFTVRYNPKNRRFKLLPGEGSNIVYLNNDDLDGPVELNAGDIIEISETKLRFAPLCGEGFDWKDSE